MPRASAQFGPSPVARHRAIRPAGAPRRRAAHLRARSATLEEALGVRDPAYRSISAAACSGPGVAEPTFIALDVPSVSVLQIPFVENYHCICCPGAGIAGSLKAHSLFSTLTGTVKPLCLSYTWTLIWKFPNFTAMFSFTRAKFEGTFGFLDSDRDGKSLGCICTWNIIWKFQNFTALSYPFEQCLRAPSFSIRTGTAKSIWFICTWSLAWKFPAFSAMFL